jgi:hypothetical protein
MAKGEYYTPEFKEQAVKKVVGLDCTYDLLHALQGRCFRLDAHPDRARSASPRRGQTPGMTRPDRGRPARAASLRRTASRTCATTRTRPTSLTARNPVHLGPPASTLL